MPPPPRQLISCFDTLVFAVDVLTHADGSARDGAAKTLSACRAAGKRAAIVAAESESTREALHARLAREGPWAPATRRRCTAAEGGATAWARARAPWGAAGVCHVLGGESLRAAVRAGGLEALAVPALAAASAARRSAARRSSRTRCRPRRRSRRCVLRAAARARASGRERGRRSRDARELRGARSLFSSSNPLAHEVDAVLVGYDLSPGSRASRAAACLDANSRCKLVRRHDCRRDGPAGGGAAAARCPAPAPRSRRPRRGRAGPDETIGFGLSPFALREIVRAARPRAAARARSPTRRARSSSATRPRTPSSRAAGCCAALTLDGDARPGAPADRRPAGGAAQAPRVRGRQA